MSDTKCKIRPRNDFVVVRKEKVDRIRGVHLPDVSEEGWRYVVEATGTKDCDDLKPGDVIRVNGQVNVHWAPIPNFPDHIIVRQECVVLVLEPVEGAYDQVNGD